MGLKTGIAWCDHTVNMWWGCEQVQNHAGCDNCYALSWDKRYGGDHWNNRRRREIQTAFKTLDKIQRSAEMQGGTKHKVFIGSMMDIFEPNRLLDTGGETRTLRDELFTRIDLNSYPNIIFQLLTKRPSMIPRCVPVSWMTEGAPDNIWFGTSISVAEHATRYRDLLVENTPANAHRFLSVEPLLSYVDVMNLVYVDFYDEPYLKKADGIKEKVIHWIIAGGESGPRARPTHPEWLFRMMIDCRDANVPFFFKQWGEFAPTKWAEPADFVLTIGGEQKKPEEADYIMGDVKMSRYGKHSTGHLLDGVEYYEFPKEMMDEQAVR